MVKCKTRRNRSTVIYGSLDECSLTPPLGDHKGCQQGRQDTDAPVRRHLHAGPHLPCASQTYCVHFFFLPALACITCLGLCEALGQAEAPAQFTLQRNNQKYEQVNLVGTWTGSEAWLHFALHSPQSLRAAANRCESQ